MESKTSNQDFDVEQVVDEKNQAIHEEFQTGALAPEDAEFLNNFPEKRRRAILCKVDVSRIFLDSRSQLLINLVAYHSHACLTLSDGIS